MGHDFEPLSARIIEAAIAVHKALGPGFLESIYHAALRVALSRSGIPQDEIESITKTRKYENTKMATVASPSRSRRVPIQFYGNTSLGCAINRSKPFSEKQVTIVP